LYKGTPKNRDFQALENMDSRMTKTQCFFSYEMNGGSLLLFFVSVRPTQQRVSKVELLILLEFAFAMAYFQEERSMN